MAMKSMVDKPTHFILDVDGVLTDGSFLYSTEGKVFKVFGPDDNDALALVAPYLGVQFITGDKRGFPIAAKRIIEDMGYPLELVSTTQRIEWIEERYDPKKVVFMGDGIFDHYVMKRVGYSIAPANADAFTKSSADYITSRRGGDRAVSEACLHLLAKFFTPYDRDIPI